MVDYLTLECYLCNFRVFGYFDVLDLNVWSFS